MRRRDDDAPRHATDGLAAEARAVQGGHNACRSGFHRASFPVPCKHAALAGRRLEREGFARSEVAGSEAAEQLQHTAEAA